MKINITLPCYNEETVLKNNILTLYKFCNKNLANFDYFLVISNNNSKDKTGDIGKKLQDDFQNINYIFVREQGKGAAIRNGWQNFPADIYIFMDADLATDIKDLPNLINALTAENYDMAIGSRMIMGANLERSPMDKFISLGYKLVRKIILSSQISDAPCGFKAINNSVFTDILPLVKNNQWFFDNELLILAEKNECKIKEIPVNWHEPRGDRTEDEYSKLKISCEYLKNLIRLRREINK